MAMAALEHFNPAIDRYDRRSAERLFGLLWPDPKVSRAVAMNMDASIRAAHATADGSWEVTMFAVGVRLNVGQVETLTLRQDVIRFFFRAPLELKPGHCFQVHLTDQPIFPAVPVPSGICDVSVADVPFLPAPVRAAHDSYIEAAASFKRVSPFKKSFSPAILEHIELVLGTELPRPSYLLSDSLNTQVVTLPDEVDFAQPLFEGARYQVTVNAYERNPIARRRCIAKHGTACVICGFSFGKAFGSIAEGLIHVHHLFPLSEIKREYEVNPEEDLRPVCPNCHAMLHHRVPAFTIEEVRAFLGKQAHV